MKKLKKPKDKPNIFLKKRNHLVSFLHFFVIILFDASMAELVDALDSKSGGLLDRVGSTPTAGIFLCFFLRVYKDIDQVLIISLTR